MEQRAIYADETRQDEPRRKPSKSRRQRQADKASKYAELFGTLGVLLIMAGIVVVVYYGGFIGSLLGIAPHAAPDVAGGLTQDNDNGLMVGGATFALGVVLIMAAPNARQR